jgi:hypothetical protein
MLQQSTRISIALALLSFTGLGMAHDIEPRRWTPLRVGMNVLGAGVVHTQNWQLLALRSALNTDHW